ncbi:MAG: DUF4294 domain-containing protein [Lewinellaceae bacterium]|nr:DUF4294 domain-containing protein [Lewinellaceae bacterium]MCB9288029.1 DUF4294 domain-containing protein [Lewinellaceae bacterium]
MRKTFLLIITALGFSGIVQGQSNGTVSVNGQQYPYIIDDCGDTLIVATLDDVSISTMRDFKNREDYLRYRRYRRYATKVYPYAVEAIKIFREVEYATQTMKERQRKKYIKTLHKDLKREFTDPLKHLTKTQGMILIKMIERELDTPVYYLIKDLRNGLTATYWSTMGSLFGHDLKEGYHEGNDPILDAVLQDMNVSYNLPDVRGTK